MLAVLINVMIYGSNQFEEEFELFLIILRYILQVIRIGSILYKAKKSFETMYKGKNLFIQDIKVNLNRYIVRKKRDTEEIIEII